MLLTCKGKSLVLIDRAPNLKGHCRAVSRRASEALLPFAHYSWPSLCDLAFAHHRSEGEMPAEASVTFKPETLSMVNTAPDSASVPGYAGHKPGFCSVIGQRVSAATAHTVRLGTLQRFCFLLSSPEQLRTAS